MNDDYTIEVLELSPTFVKADVYRAMHLLEGNRTQPFIYQCMVRCHPSKEHVVQKFRNAKTNQETCNFKAPFTVDGITKEISSPVIAIEKDCFDEFGEEVPETIKLFLNISPVIRFVEDVRSP